MMFLAILSALMTSVTASLPSSPSSKLQMKYHEGLGKQIVHLNGSPLCISSPATADARNRILNLLAHKICSNSNGKHFGTYHLLDSGWSRVRTRNVDCRLSRDKYQINCYFESSKRDCQKFIEVKCKSCHREDTVSTFNAVTLRNPLFPRLVPGWACTYDVTLDKQYLLHKTKMVLKIFNLSLPPADYAITPGRAQCIESYIQILQGSDVERLSVVATLCDDHDKPLFYNISEPHLQIRFVSGNRFHPDLTGFSIVVSAYHEFSVPHVSNPRNWKYFLPLIILIFFVIIFCVGVIFCLAVLCSERKRKMMRSGTRPSWQMTPTHPLEVRTRPARGSRLAHARGSRLANPSSRENAYIVDNTTRPRTVVADNPGTSIQQRSLPTPGTSIQQRSLPTPPPVTPRLENCSSSGGVVGPDTSDGYMSVNCNNQSGIYMNATDELGNSFSRTDNLIQFVNRNNQLGDSINISNNSMNRTNGSYKTVNRFNQSNQSIMSRIFSVRTQHKSCLRNSEYLDMTGSSDSDIYIEVNAPKVPRRPTWTYETPQKEENETPNKEVIYETREKDVFSGDEEQVYLTVVKSPEKISLDESLKISDDGHVNNMEEGNDRKVSASKWTNLNESLEVVDVFEDGKISTIHLISNNVANTPSEATNISLRESVLSNDCDQGSKNEASLDLVQDFPRVNTEHSHCEVGETPSNFIDQTKVCSEDAGLDEDLRIKRNAHKCAMSQLKRKIRNSYRSVSSKIEDFSISSGGFTYWEIDREDLLPDDHKMDDVFEE